MVVVAAAAASRVDPQAWEANGKPESCTPHAERGRCGVGAAGAVRRRQKFPAPGLGRALRGPESCRGRPEPPRFSAPDPGAARQPARPEPLCIRPWVAMKRLGGGGRPGDPDVPGGPGWRSWGRRDASTMFLPKIKPCRTP